MKLAYINILLTGLDWSGALFPEPCELIPFPVHATRRTEFDEYEHPMINKNRLMKWICGGSCLNPVTDLPTPHVDWLAFTVCNCNVLKYV